ncbi:MAG: S1 family peptidase [Leucobacter sp.]
MTKRRPLALGAAAAIGFGSLFFAAPALAEEAASLPVTDQTEEQAPSLEDVEQVAAALDAEGVSLYGSVTASGEQVLLTSEVEEGSKAEETVEQAVESEGADRFLQLAGPAERLASTDAVGGAGYLGWLPNPEDGGGHCSIGFSAWSGTGEPAIVTAGHCSLDGALSDVALTLPSGQPAAGGPGTSDTTHDLGTFGFNQFGGAGNTSGAEGDSSSIDIAVIEGINDELDLLPEVTDWSTAGSDDLAASTTPVTAVGTVDEGDVVTHSGRTTGSKSGDVIFEDGWLNIGGFNGDDDVRWVHGFAAEMVVDGGDSGGAIVRGETAVGVASAKAQLTDGTNIIWGSHLESALDQVPGAYEIALSIDSPEVTSHNDGAELEPGETIAGTAPGNAVSIGLSTQPNSGDSVPVEDGTWSTTAPSEPGEYTLSYSARNGHSTSETAEFEFEVLESNVLPPVVTSPANGSTVEGPVESIEGTGIPGAALTMEGDISSDVEVAADGTWTVTTEGPLENPGEYSIQVYQTVDGEDSRTITSTFTIEGDDAGEIAPIEITSISDGDQFALSDAPTSVSGTAEPGETVVVDVYQAGGSGDAGSATATAAGETLAVEVGGDGSWTHALEYEPVLGTFSVSYGYEGAGSGDSLSFTLVEDGTTPPPGEDEDPPAEDGDDNGNNGGGNGGDDELAETGLDAISLLPYIGAAAAMLLLGTAVTLFAARRQRGGNATE